MIRFPTFACRLCSSRLYRYASSLSALLLYPARSQAEVAIERKHGEVVNRLLSENRRLLAAEGGDAPPSGEGSPLAEAEAKATVAVRAAKEAEAKAAIAARKEAEANLALRTSLDSSQQVHCP